MMLTGEKVLPTSGKRVAARKAVSSAACVAETFEISNTSLPAIDLSCEGSLSNSHLIRVSMLEKPTQGLSSQSQYGRSWFVSKEVMHELGTKVSNNRIWTDECEDIEQMLSVYIPPHHPPGFSELGLIRMRDKRHSAEGAGIRKGMTISAAAFASVVAPSSAWEWGGQPQ